MHCSTPVQNIPDAHFTVIPLATIKSIVHRHKRRLFTVGKVQWKPLL